MKERTLEEIEAEIAATKAELENVHGTETEVYARIVGYYRSVKNWNKGKRDEYTGRRLFVIDEKECGSAGSDTVPFSEPARETGIIDNSMQYELFTRRTCPNCPPVKNFMKSLPIAGAEIDVDTEEGFSRAAEKGVFASPTVIIFDKNGRETARGHSVEELEAIFDSVLVKAAV